MSDQRLAGFWIFIEDFEKSIQYFSKNIGRLNFGIVAKLVNRSQLKNPDISGVTTTLSVSILILNFQCVEGARDVRVL